MFGDPFTPTHKVFGRLGLTEKKDEMVVGRLLSCLEGNFSGASC